MIRLALLRHGRTPWNRAGRIQGRTDVALDAEAEADLAARALPAPWASAALWSSPLIRARRTAELVAGRAPRTDPALTEMDWGDWEGLKGIDLRADPASGYRDIEDWGWEYRPPGGESPADLRARLQPWVDGLQQDSLAVCHIGIMRVLMAQATGWDFDGPAPFQIKRSRLYVLTIDGEDWRAEPTPVRLKARQT
ncbi:histidine phosphatase family protein [Roseobacter sp. MH60115]|uniref:histidine phosphatase family protein n=1 Tax=Roseobacter sp. MH60115 TaxID=2785324 RepID=UPI0018A2A8AD|nr:histidine phosphatase family protein [Roseobacter sp. MH60115]